MSEGENVLIVGASARAAAFSALRAGLRPWCIDLFADDDLAGRCPTMRLRGHYPNGFLDMIDMAPPGPWLYTGGLENHPFLVSQLANRRLLWGNGPAVLVRVRDPEFLTQTARSAGLPAPRVIRKRRQAPPEGCWLTKPLQGAGGSGIAFCAANERSPAGSYLQQYIEGEPAAALYAGLERRAYLLGLTRQFVGADWLGAAPFHYCGSVGPIEVAADLRAGLQRLGEALVARAGLCGLFGVDGILAGGSFWPVEVNPRYTASVEVLEHALGLRALNWHRRAFVADARPFSRDAEALRSGALRAEDSASRLNVVGKAILFARADLVFPDDGPWRDVLRCPVDDMPDFADLPHAGDEIDAGRPVLTLFARGPSVAACVLALRERTKEVEGWLGSQAIG